MAGKDLFGPLATEIELRAEKASALRRIAGRLEGLLAELRALESELAPRGTPERKAQLEAHAVLRKQAEEQRWYLIVQREAIGLRQHQDLHALYPIPPAPEG